jgi:diguanylate cyclase (GGDEF)-like protein
MDNQIQNVEHLADFRIKTTLGVTLIALLLLTPFTINNFLQDRLILGLASLTILILCAANAWTCIRNRYYSSLIFLFLVPAVIFFLVMAFREQGAFISYWCYLAVLSFYFMLPERQAWISNIIFLSIIFPQAWGILEQAFMLRFVVTILGVSAFSAMFVRVITAQQEILKMHAVIDPLTGLLNRTTLNDTFEVIIQQNRRTGVPMTIAVLDIDKFKVVNDKFGHNRGDKVLRGIAEFLHKRIHRRTDSVFRMGGEEFLVLLYNTNIENGRQVAEELRSDIESLNLIPDHPITVSIGIATLMSSDDQESWLKRCDENLYKAKEGGRNMVVS